MATVANIDVNLRAKTDKFDSRMKRSTGAVRKFSAVKVGGLVAGLVAAAAAARVLRNVLGKVVQQFAEVDRLAKQAASIGIGTEQLAGLQLAGKIGGVEPEALNKSLQRMVKTVFDADAGLSTAVRAFDKLGLEIKDIKGLDADELFKQIAEKSKGLSRTDKVGVFRDIFGRAGADLLNVAGGGRAGIQAEQDFARLAGTAVSGVDAKKVELANDAMTRLKEVMTGFTRTLAVELAPIIQIVLTDLTALLGEFGGMKGFVREGVEALVRAIAAVVNAFDLAVTGIAKAIDFLTNLGRGEFEDKTPGNRKGDKLLQRFLDRREELDKRARELAGKDTGGGGLPEEAGSTAGAKSLIPAALERGTSAAFSAERRARSVEHEKELVELKAIKRAIEDLPSFPLVVGGE